MARTINKLSAAFVAKTNKPGRYADGGGLYLQVSQFGTKAWLYRFMINGTARQMGLGSVNTFSLKEARERALKARQLVADGIDPIKTKNAQRARLKAERAKSISFKEAAAKYIAAHEAGWKNDKHGQQWANTLETYAYPVMGDLPVAEIDTAHVLQVLEPIWREKTETASRVRGRMESVLNWATAREFRKGDNPARWRGHLDKLLPAPPKVKKVRNQPALPYAELPGFMGSLREKEGVSAQALEFTILCAVRTGETIGARWSEIDMQAGIWTIPAERMKAGREHRVPLTDRALEILKALPREGRGDGFVFPGARKGKGLSNMAMLELLRGMKPGITVHGFRSTFRDWAAEQTNFPRELAEAALAHVLADKTEAAYLRTDRLEKRRRLMAEWAKFCAARSGYGDAEKGKVVEIRRGQ